MKKKREIISGVYMIFCNKNRKVYIGSSEDILAREWDHRSGLRNGTADGSSNLLLEDWLQYGEESFAFSTIELCNVSELIDREDYWIRVHNATNPRKGYNIRYPKTGRYGENGKLIKRITDKPVIVIDVLTGTKTKYDNNTAVSVATGIDQWLLVDYYKYWEGQHTGRRSWHNLMFIREEVYDPEFDYINYKPKPWTFTKKKPKPEKKLKLSHERNIHRVGVIAVNCETGEETIYASKKECVQKMRILPMKLKKCLEADYGKYKTHNHYFKLA